jgi:hypothetical protein
MFIVSVATSSKCANCAVIYSKGNVACWFVYAVDIICVDTAHACKYTIHTVAWTLDIICQRLEHNYAQRAWYIQYQYNIVVPSLNSKHVAYLCNYYTI